MPQLKEPKQINALLRYAQKKILNLRNVRTINNLVFDCGLKDFLVCNDGKKFNLPDEYFRIEKLIKREQQKLSRKELANIKSYKIAKECHVPVYKKPLSECKNYQKQKN